MALAATTIWEVRTGGSDTANGGAFDPGQTAGMFSDGAATVATSASPVFTSASYNFVAGDANAWLYIASGTNWTPGWYLIASVAANAATLSAAAGAGTLANGTTTTAAGCATTASPTSATWTIDYSQQDAAEFTYTDLASSGTGLTVSSAAKPFAKQQVGNSLVITGGTNFNTGRYVIASVAAGVATVVGPTNITTGAGASGTGGQGGGLASPGKAGGLQVASNDIWFKSGTYTITTTSVNAAGGPIKDVVGGSDTNPIRWEGYNTVRGDKSSTRPLFQLQASLTTSAITIIDYAGAALKCTILDNINVDANTGNTTATGINLSTNSQMVRRSIINRTTVTGLILNDQHQIATDVEIKNFSGTAGVLTSNGADGTTRLLRAYVHDGSAPGITAYQHQIIMQNIVVANITNGGTGLVPGAGIIIDFDGTMSNCTVYNCATANIHLIGRSGSLTYLCTNVLSYGAGTYNFKTEQVETALRLQMVNCAGGGAGSGNYDTSQVSAISVEGFVSLSGNPFTNAGSGDFSLNNTSGAGAACRAAGVPGAFQGGTTTGYLDIGAVQHQDGGGGSTLNLYAVE